MAGMGGMPRRQGRSKAGIHDFAPAEIAPGVVAYIVRTVICPRLHICIGHPLTLQFPEPEGKLWLPAAEEGNENKLCPDLHLRLAQRD